MYSVLKRTFLAALPLAGLLMLPAVATAHDDDEGNRHERFQHRLNDAHQDYHDGLRDLHGEYHEHPYSQRSHRQFHRWLNRDHSNFHGDLDDGNDSYRNGYGRGWHRGWDQGNSRGWYGNPRYYDNNNYQRGGRYCPPRYYGKSPSNQYPWWR